MKASSKRLHSDVVEPPELRARLQALLLPHSHALGEGQAGGPKVSDIDGIPTALL
jgi:hypothetical protein